VRFRTFSAGILVVLMSAALPIGAASAKTFTVPCDTGALITAINNANADPLKDNINLAAACTYTLTTVNNTDSDGPNGLPVITSNVNIIGNGATISRDPAAPPFRLIKVDTAGTLSTNNLVLQNGLTADGSPGVAVAAGAGMLNRGSSSLTSTSFRNNHVEVNGGLALPIGGAIANVSGATLSMTFGDVTGNSADIPTGCICTPGALVGIPLGGGIANGGALSINQTSVVGNEATADGVLVFAVGGGISSGGNPGASLDVKGAKVLNNRIETFGIINAAIGGGIGANTVTLTGTEIGGNGVIAFGAASGTAVGGGLATFGTTSIAKSTTIHDNGAGVYASGGRAMGGGVANTADLSIVSSTVTNNQAVGIGADAFGGGIQTTGNLNLSGSTVTNNTAGSQGGTALGGGVYNGPSATATISGSSITGNTAAGFTEAGGGIYNAGAPGAVTIPGSSVTMNLPDNCAPAGSVPGCTG
jgi:hypothetical protein